MPHPDRPAGHRARRVPVLLAAAALAAVAVHLWGLYAPTQPGGPAFPGADKLAHAAGFAAPVLLGLLALERGGADRRALAAVPVVFAVHAPVSEAVQGVALPGRSGDPADAVADLVGVAVAVAAYAVLHRGARAARAGG